MNLLVFMLINEDLLLKNNIYLWFMSWMLICLCCTLDY